MWPQQPEHPLRLPHSPRPRILDVPPSARPQPPTAPADLTPPLSVALSLRELPGPGRLPWRAHPLPRSVRPQFLNELTSCGSAPVVGIGPAIVPAGNQVCLPQLAGTNGRPGAG